MIYKKGRLVLPGSFPAASSLWVGCLNFQGGVKWCWRLFLSVRPRVNASGGLQVLSQLNYYFRSTPTSMLLFLRGTLTCVRQSAATHTHTYRGERRPSQSVLNNKSGPSLPHEARGPSSLLLGGHADFSSGSLLGNQTTRDNASCGGLSSWAASPDPPSCLLAS